MSFTWAKKSDTYIKTYLLSWFSFLIQKTAVVIKLKDLRNDEYIILNCWHKKTKIIWKDIFFISPSSVFIYLPILCNMNTLVLSNMISRPVDLFVIPHRDWKIKVKKKSSSFSITVMLALRIQKLVLQKSH